MPMIYLDHEEDAPPTIPDVYVKVDQSPWDKAAIQLELRQVDTGGFVIELTPRDARRVAAALNEVADLIEAPLEGAKGD